MKSFLFLLIILATLTQTLAFEPVTGTLKPYTDAYFLDPTTTETLHGPIAAWDVSGVTDFSQAFALRSSFDEDIS